MKLWIYQALMRGLSLLPLSAIHRIGASLGWLGVRIPNQLRTISRVNLELCLGEQSADWRRDVLRQSLANTGKVFTEVAALWFWKPERVDDLVVASPGWQHIERALESGRGLIVLSPHTGSWELGGHYLSRRMPLTLMYRPPRDAVLENQMIRIRESAGARLVPTSAAGIRALRKALKAGEAIALLPDQMPRKGAGVFAPLFGLPAYTMLLVSRLARKDRTPTVMAIMKRLEKGRGFEFHAIPVGDALYDENDEVSAGAMNEALEKMIRNDPTQYMWLYKRFQLMPDGKREYR